MDLTYMIPKQEPSCTCTLTGTRLKEIPRKVRWYSLYWINDILGKCSEPGGEIPSHLPLRSEYSPWKCHVVWVDWGPSVTSILPKWNGLQETQKWAQPTGCPLSHWCPKKLGSSYGVLQLIFKLREVCSHENWYIYIMRKSCDRWLCTQSWSQKGPCAKVWDIHAWWLCMVHDTIHHSAHSASRGPGFHPELVPWQVELTATGLSQWHLHRTRNNTKVSQSNYTGIILTLCIPLELHASKAVGCSSEWNHGMPGRTAKIARKRGDLGKA